MRDFYLPESMARARRQIEFEDEFGSYTSGQFWTSLASDGGVTAPVGVDAEWGRVSMATAATDNNEVMVRSTNEIALFQADGSFMFQSLIQFTESNTDDANVAVGMANAAGADLLSDNGGGDNINSSGVLIFKVDGETVWRCASEINGTIVETQSDQTAGGASFQMLSIIGRPVDGTNYEFTYFLDDKALTTTANGITRPIRHRLAYASATEMRLVAGYIKAGSASEETLLIDYCAFTAVRV